MADTDADAKLPRLTKEEEVAYYWIRQLLLCGPGMTFSQAEALAWQPGLDRHAVCETLKRGCDPSVAYDIYSA